MAKLQKIAPCLWFDGKAEEAVQFYASVFEGSKVLYVSRYPSEGQEIHGQKAGTVLTVEFELEGQRFTALNGGPLFKFNEAISFQVYCDTQAELDRLWDKLGEGGDPAARQCGWLKDRFGVSWQVVPREMDEMLTGGNPEATARAFKAMMGMKKLDIAELERAHEGETHDARV